MLTVRAAAALLDWACGRKRVQRPQRSCQVRGALIRQLLDQLIEPQLSLASWPVLQLIFTSDVETQNYSGI
jgi:hypothetical protein